MPTFQFDRRMNALDARHYYFGLDPNLNVSMGVLLLLDHAPDLEQFHEAWAAASILVPRLRQVPTAAPFNLARPIWRDLPDFDVRHQFRHITLDTVTLETLTDAADDFHSAPFDLDRPLWDYCLVEGRNGTGQAGVLIRLHHSLSDGSALAVMLSRVFMADLYDLEPAKEITTHELPATEHPLNAILRDRLLAVKELAQAGRRLLPDFFTVAGWRNAALETAGIVLPPPSGRIGQHRSGRHSAHFVVPQAVWRSRARQAGGTSNDLFVALAAALLRRSGVYGERDRYRIIMPVDVRARETTVDAGNVTGLAFLALDGDDHHLGDLSSIRSATKAGRTAARNWKGGLTDPLLDLLPGRTQADLALRMYAKTDALATNVVIPVPMKMGGATVESCFVQPTTIGGPIGLCMITYDDAIHLTVIADAGVVPDVDVLALEMRRLLSQLFDDDSSNVDSEDAA